MRFPLLLCACRAQRHFPPTWEVDTYRARNARPYEVEPDLFIACGSWAARSPTQIRRIRTIRRSTIPYG